jgi:hypothetical protein
LHPTFQLSRPLTKLAPNFHVSSTKLLSNQFLNHCTELTRCLETLTFKEGVMEGNPRKWC